MVIPNDYGFAMLKVPALKTKKDYSWSMFVRKVLSFIPQRFIGLYRQFLGEKEKPEFRMRIIQYVLNIPYHLYAR